MCGDWVEFDVWEVVARIPSGGYVGSAGEGGVMARLD